MTTYLNTGMTEDEMLEMVLAPSKLSGKTAEKEDGYRYMNLIQLMMMEWDWPELIQVDGSFTTDGSTSYDLSDASYLGERFWRPVDGTVRINDYYMQSITKQMYDRIDPSRYSGTVPVYYCAYKRDDFRLFPYGSSGDTCYLDWIAAPVKLESGATCSFSPEHRYLIALGGMYMCSRDYYPAQGGYPEWLNHKRVFEDELKKAVRKISLVRKNVHSIHPISC